MVEDRRLSETRPDGPDGVLIDDVEVKGVSKTKSGLVAVITARGRDFMLTRGTRVIDGEVIQITTSQVVFRQWVDDPAVMERFRDVVKSVRDA